MNQMLAGAAAGLVLAPVAFAFTRWALAPYRKRRDQLRATPTPSAADWAAKLAAQDRAAQIVLRDDQLILNNDRLRQQPFALSQLRNVSIVTRATPGSLRSSLEFRGQRTLVVPALAQGVPVLLAWLRTQPGFDEPAWNRILAATKTERATVLRRPQAVNARWLQGVPDVLALVLPRPSGDIPVSWDILYADLRRLPGVELLPDSYGTPQLRLGPARIGSLALDELWVRGKVPRDDVPVRAWSSSTVLEPEGRERNYRQLRDFFDSLAGPQQRGSYDRADAAQWVGSHDGIEVRLLYWHDSDYAPESGYCSLQMTNARPYPRFLTDPYCASLRLEDIDSTLLGLHGVFVEQDFRASAWVRDTPPALAPLFQPGVAEYLVWRDRQPGRIGFANPQHAVILDPGQAVRLELGNATPARGGGYSVLQLIDPAGGKVRVATAEYRALDPFVDQLQQATGLTIERLPEYPDD